MTQGQPKPTPRAVSSNEAKQRWGAVLGEVGDRGGEIIVEHHGKPKAVLISIAAYEEVQALREQKRRADILDRLRALQQRITARDLNRDLNEAAAMALADRFSHELLDDLAADGVLVFERDHDHDRT